MSIHELAERLDNAAREAREIPQFDTQNSLSLEEAYAIQAASVARRVARGEQRVGVKMGFTSRAKMAQMGLSDVIWGRLTDAMQIEEGGNVDSRRFVHPRCEPELAFILKRPLAGNITAPQALAAVEAIAPALEIIDSRYKDFHFTLPEVIADNASSSGFVIGAWCDPRTDFSNLGMTLNINGRVAHVGSTAALLGHPLRSLVAAARLAEQAGEPLQAGWVVLAGGATAAEWIHPGDHVSVEMQTLGSAGFYLKGVHNTEANHV
ncbi:MULTISPECIES: 2-keto-4-pentenoate hydratase [Enterobacteriaceae]|uniref:4-oxalocrotonate decarboxylase n=1 Tax=Escherichia coli TaxID=562 RepID=A0A2P9E621_ECOLX|nr:MULTISPECIES: fumarylacetoacetate hydrolase family protein [Enterobacteriaceae]HCC2477540.1 fumarylacetoacetate hydrolase family protein [Klebsiella variicola]HCU0658121.1 fumarylacetoacetate hydrolase family protein [Klebsiella quasipneumoniae]EKZ5605731.1 fumarylacetoacetate hydrolase family protein [Klebsiella pneumoniae]EKZ5764667.1 fumarylacetoacetate hydrolase family protein [Klebsiella pneumoniae]ELA0504818.1 fumarylacetoacetate hydrolase family protein [Klebsiella pneumoniae]